MEAFASGELLEVAMAEALKASYRDFLDKGRGAPATPRFAATVMLVRDTPAAGPEVFMLRRARTMAFVPDAVVFPGGSVDKRDSDPSLPWSGPAPELWAAQMGCDEETARRVVVAAAREVFEETGVLLAGADEASVVGDLSDPAWAGERARLTSHEESFAEMLIRRGLVLRTDLMGLRSHWLTPEFEPRRYDTFFFAALLPPDQRPDDKTSEAAAANWVLPKHLLDEAAEGKVLLLPPTNYNLSQLLHARSAASFVLEGPPVKRIMLKPAIKADGEVVLQCVLP